MRNANGASLLLETLLDEGVTHLFGNPGTTELPPHGRAGERGAA